MLCLYKVNTTTTLKDIKEAFIYSDLPIKNLKRNIIANGLPMTLVTFSIVNSSVSTEILKSGLVLNPLSANFSKWSNTLRQFVGKLPMSCLSVFDHFVGLALNPFMTEADII